MKFQSRFARTRIHPTAGSEGLLPHYSAWGTHRDCKTTVLRGARAGRAPAPPAD
jgi:hypothetical protein